MLGLAGLLIGPGVLARAQVDEAPARRGEPPALRQPGRTGVGAQVGEPGGVAVKWYRQPPVAYAAALTTDGGDYALLLVNRLWEARLRNSSLGAFVGPGLTVGTTGLRRSAALASGLNGLAGLNFYAHPLEVFLQVTTRVRFLPQRVDDVGGSVGLRLYL